MTLVYFFKLNVFKVSRLVDSKGGGAHNLSRRAKDSSFMGGCRYAE
jgi:hypothetical protein